MRGQIYIIINSNLPIFLRLDGPLGPVGRTLHAVAGGTKLDDTYGGVWPIGEGKEEGGDKKTFLVQAPIRQEQALYLDLESSCLYRARPLTVGCHPESG